MKNASLRRIDTSANERCSHSARGALINRALHLPGRRRNMTANKVSGVFPAQRRYSLASRRLMALRVLIACLVALFTSNGFAQQPDSQPPDVPPGQANDRPHQPTQVRSASFAATGDSAAGSIGGVKTPQSTTK